MYWPKYSVDERKSVAWVRDGLGHRSFELKDDYRKEGMELLMDLRSGMYDHSSMSNAVGERGMSFEQSRRRRSDKVEQEACQVLHCRNDKWIM